MYIVNTSFFVEPQANERWLELARGYYLPTLEQEGFDRVTLSRVVSEDVPQGFTYSLMVEVDDMQAYLRLSGEIFDRYRRVADPLFGESVLWLTTLLKRIEYGQY